MLEEGAGAVDRRVDRTRWARRVEEVERLRDPPQVERLAGEQQRRLGEGGQRLVGRQHQRVGAERHRVLRQAGVEAEVGPPGAVDQQRHAGRLAVAAEGGDVGQHADVRRLGQEHRAGIGVRGQRVGHALRWHPARQARARIELRPYEHGVQAAEHEGREQGAVDRPRHDHGRTGPGDAQRHRLVGLAGAVDDEPAPVGSPGACGTSFGRGQHALALAQVVDRAGQRQVECQERIRHGGVAAVARSGE